MDKLAKSMELIELFDFYGELLTQRQKDYFIDYYFNDYSLHEISENYGVSRNAVYDQIKKTVQKLYDYEKKLELKKQSNKRKKLLEMLKKHIRSEGYEVLQELEKLE